MRIAVNTRFLLTDRLEGIGWFTHEVVRRLVERRPDDTFIFFFDRPFDTQFQYGSNVEMVHLIPPARHGFLWYLWFEWAIPFALKKYQADVFLSLDNFCSLRANTPTVMVMHDLAHLHYPEQIPAWALKYYTKNIPRFIDKADEVVTVSNFTKQDIIQHYGTSAKKVSVACNGVREGFRPLNIVEKIAVRNEFSDGQDYFFYVGAVHPRKNISRLIQAFDAFKIKSGTPVKLLIAGRMAWQTSDIESVYQQARHKEDIQFLGYISDEQLCQLTGAALALTYVSLFEGFGVPLLEAMHCDTPIITSNVSSMPEVVGEAALLIDPTKVNEIAAAMEQLFEDENLQKKLASNGQIQRQKFTWDGAVDVVECAIQLWTESS